MKSRAMCVTSPKNVQAQQRRKAQGLKVAEVNMHMIFTGTPHRQDDDCPHTGQVPEAIGALRGGQLVEAPAPIWWAAMSATRPR